MTGNPHLKKRQPHKTQPLQVTHRLQRQLQDATKQTSLDGDRSPGEAGDDFRGGAEEAAQDQNEHHLLHRQGGVVSGLSSSKVSACSMLIKEFCGGKAGWNDRAVFIETNFG